MLTTTTPAGLIVPVEGPEQERPTCARCGRDALVEHRTSEEEGEAWQAAQALGSHSCSCRMVRTAGAWLHLD